MKEGEVSFGATRMREKSSLGGDRSELGSISVDTSVASPVLGVGDDGLSILIKLLIARQVDHVKDLSVGLDSRIKRVGASLGADEAGDEGNGGLDVDLSVEASTELVPVGREALDGEGVGEVLGGEGSEVGSGGGMRSGGSFGPGGGEGGDLGLDVEDVELVELERGEDLVGHDVDDLVEVGDGLEVDRKAARGERSREVEESGVELERSFEMRRVENVVACQNERSASS